MAASLVSVVMQFLTPDLIAKIASGLGLDRSVAQKAIGGAVPTLLSSLADVVTNPNGARQLTNIVAQQQQGSLDTFKSLIGGSDQNRLAETGSSTLSGLFGSSALDTMAQSIGKFAGVDASSIKSLLGMLGPVVLGNLGSTAAQCGPGCKRAGVPSHIAKGANRRGHSVRLGRSVERGWPSRQSRRSLAQRHGGGFCFREPNCQRRGTDSCRDKSGGLRVIQCGPVAVALLAGRASDIRWVCLVHLWSSGSREGCRVAAPGHHANHDRNGRHGSSRSDGWRSESGEPGQLVRQRLEVRASGHHGRRLG